MLSNFMRRLFGIVNLVPRADPPAGGDGGDGKVAVFDGDENLLPDEQAFLDSQLNDDPEYRALIEKEGEITGKGKEGGKKKKAAGKGEDEGGGEEEGGGEGAGKDEKGNEGEGEGGEEEEDLDISDLKDLDRPNLKKIILDEELDISVNREMSDDDIRKAIAEARDEVLDDEDIEYSDDVIQGLKGKDFGAMTKRGKFAIANFHKEHESLKEENGRVKTEMESLLNDPIVKHRKELIDSGRSAFSYELPAFDKAAFKKILDEPDDDKAYQLLNAEFQRQGNSIADTYVKNRLIVENARRQMEKNDEAGDKVFYDAVKLHPKFKDAKIDIAFLKNPANKNNPFFKAVVEPLINYCLNRKWKYDTIAKMTEKELYAAAGAALGWPVAVNTEKRDLNIQASARMDVLSRFVKGPKKKGEATTLASKGGNFQRQQRGKFNSEGVDEVRLAQDDDYHDRILNSKPYDENWVDKVTAWRRKGEEKLSKKK